LIDHVKQACTDGAAKPAATDMVGNQNDREDIETHLEPRDDIGTIAGQSLPVNDGAAPSIQFRMTQQLFTAAAGPYVDPVEFNDEAERFSYRVIAIDNEHYVPVIGHSIAFIRKSAISAESARFIGYAQCRFDIAQGDDA